MTGLWPRACKLAGTVEQTGGYNFYIKGKNKKANSSLLNQVHNSPLHSDRERQRKRCQDFGNMESFSVDANERNYLMEQEGVVKHVLRTMVNVQWSK